MHASALATAPTAHADPGPIVPAANDQLVEIIELLPPSVCRQLGYFGSSNWVLFYYDAGAHDVMWDDGHCVGIGTGGWQTFVDLIVPLARRYSADPGSAASKATHALLINRADYSAYFANRLDAQQWVRRQQRSRFSRRFARATQGR